MSDKALALKYRPKSWDDVSEQSSTKIILQQQLKSNTFKHAYLFCGPAGCGKTTCARIFANDINKGQGNPIEMDAASNNSVEDVRRIIQQAQTKSLDSEYKVFIIDECHALSNAAWQAMLKVIEEPPMGAIFIFATTDPQKIPPTIISRVQRYDFQRISQSGIEERLTGIYTTEYPKNKKGKGYEPEAIQYIAKIADGGMRDAITLMDKCLGLSDKLTLQNVVDALGVVDYAVMLDLTDAILDNDANEAISKIESFYLSGKDLKQFVKQYIQFLLDVRKYDLGCDWEFIQIPELPEYKKWLDSLTDDDMVRISDLLSDMINISADIKYSNSPKYDLEAGLIVTFGDGNNED
jgi:DNA polymerase-3 subunit gamma/tau